MKLGNKLFDIIVNILRNDEESRNNDVVIGVVVINDAIGVVVIIQ